MAPRPRIAMIVPDLPVAPDWVAAAAVHHDVTCLELRPSPSSPPPAPFDPATPWPLRYRRRRPGRVFAGANAASAATTLTRATDALATDRQPIDLVHGHFFSGCAGLPGLHLNRSLPYVVSEHSSALTTANPEKEISSAGLRIARRVYASAAAVLPVSESLADAIRARNLPGAIRVVPNPVDTDTFRPGPVSDRPRVVVVARLTSVKRIDLILEATARLRDTVRDVQLDIAGDGPELARLRRLATTLDLADCVRFHGRLGRDDVARLLAAGSVFAMASHTENLPVAALEALASGLPIVAPAVGGIPEIMQAAPGQLFEPGDIDACTAGLGAWLRPDARTRDAARAAAVERYSIRAVGDELRTVYAAALGAETEAVAG